MQCSQTLGSWHQSHGSSAAGSQPPCFSPKCARSCFRRQPDPMANLQLTKTYLAPQWRPYISRVARAAITQRKGLTLVTPGLNLNVTLLEHSCRAHTACSLCNCVSCASAQRPFQLFELLQLRLAAEQHRIRRVPIPPSPVAVCVQSDMMQWLQVNANKTLLLAPSNEISTCRTPGRSRPGCWAGPSAPPIVHLLYRCPCNGTEGMLEG